MFGVLPASNCSYTETHPISPPKEGREKKRAAGLAHHGCWDLVLGRRSVTRTEPQDRETWLEFRKTKFVFFSTFICSSSLDAVKLKQQQIRNKLREIAHFRVDSFLLEYAMSRTIGLPPPLQSCCCPCRGRRTTTQVTQWQIEKFHFCFCFCFFYFSSFSISQHFRFSMCSASFVKQWVLHLFLTVSKRQMMSLRHSFWEAKTTRSNKVQLWQQIIWKVKNWIFEKNILK